jgi:hypothetical protein
MPDGWEQKLTAKGKVYYIDHNSKRTHWELPKVLNKLSSSSLVMSSLQADDNEV